MLCSRHEQREVQKREGQEAAIIARCWRNDSSIARQTKLQHDLGASVVTLAVQPMGYSFPMLKSVSVQRLTESWGPGSLSPSSWLVR